ncbi:MAG: hypothetical protein SGARI_005636 [Bacillariaceae sp.]
MSATLCGLFLVSSRRRISNNSPPLNQPVHAAMLAVPAQMISRRAAVVAAKLSAISNCASMKVTLIHLMEI